MHTPARPRQLLATALAACAVLALAACDSGKPATEEETASAILPQAQFRIVLTKVEPGNRSGEEIYNAICFTCHAAGTLNAPKFGDAADWAPRLAKGYDALYQSVLNGLGAMPPKGGLADLTDAELHRALVHMTNSAGGQFAVPAEAQ